MKDGLEVGRWKVWAEIVRNESLHRGGGGLVGEGLMLGTVVEPVYCVYILL